MDATALTKANDVRLDEMTGGDRLSVRYLLELLNYGRSTKSTRYWVMKRIADLILAVIATITLSPFLVLIALAIKLDSPGPVIFRQERIGEGLRIFQIWKFRTMFQDADDSIAAVINPETGKNQRLASTEDPRVTRMGRLLRRYSLDELPQLYNILTGRMSIVGPRPLALAEGTALQIEQLQRYSVPAGLTGLAQITNRSSVFDPERFNPDLAYLDKMSFKTDTLIILKTFRALKQP